MLIVFFALYMVYSSYFRGIRSHTSVTGWRSTIRALNIYEAIFGEVVKDVCSDFLSLECSFKCNLNV